MRESAAEPRSVDCVSLSDDDSWSLQSSVPQSSVPGHGDSDDVGCTCARTGYVLPLERWSGKRKRNDSTAGSKHMKTSTKPTWVDGLGRDADDSLNRISETRLHVDTGPASHPGQVGTPSPTKSTASSSAASSPMKLADKCVPATQAQPPPPPLPLSPAPRVSSRKHSSHDAENSAKTRPPDGDSVRRTRLSTTESASKSSLNSAENSAKTHPSAAVSVATESVTRARTSAAATKGQSSSSSMSPTSAAVSSIVGMSPPATPVMPETQVTQNRRQSKQKPRSQRDPNSLPCKGNITELSFDNRLLYPWGGVV